MRNMEGTVEEQSISAANDSEVRDSVRHRAKIKDVVHDRAAYFRLSQIMTTVLTIVRCTDGLIRVFEGLLLMALIVDSSISTANESEQRNHLRSWSKTSSLIHGCSDWKKLLITGKAIFLLSCLLPFAVLILNAWYPTGDSSISTANESEQRNHLRSWSKTSSLILWCLVWKKTLINYW